MEIVPSKRLRSLAPYAFAEVDASVARLKQEGIRPIDFGVGDPTSPTPPSVREACREGVHRRATAGYPAYAGAPEFREAAARWLHRRFGVTVDPATEVLATIGSKEAIFHVHEGLLDPGDRTLVPSPGYPPYYRGTLFAEGMPVPYALRPEERFRPRLDRLAESDVRGARALWINYPNSPTGAVARLDELQAVADFCRKRGIVLFSDEAYSEIWFGEPPPSALQTGTEGLLAFFSLSKRSAMTCYRVGFVAGDRRLVDLLRRVKTNLDSGTPTFIQDAAVAALADEDHVGELREEYRAKRDLVARAFVELGLPDCTPEATLYLWQKGPPGMSSEEFARRLLEPEVALVATPGTWLSERVADGTNPGEGYVRLALVPTIEESREAVKRLRRLRL
jgi:LL-diaminopimelate aminotransferase